jgi:hypothetical protein
VTTALDGRLMQWYRLQLPNSIQFTRRLDQNLQKGGIEGQDGDSLKRKLRSALTAVRTTASTTARINIRQSMRRPAFRWYSCAVVSSSAAEEVFCATLLMLDSMLSV